MWFFGRKLHKWQNNWNNLEWIYAFSVYHHQSRRLPWWLTKTRSPSKRQFWQYKCNGHFSSWVDSQYSSCVHRIHISPLHKTQSVICVYLIIPRTRVRVFSELIEFQTPVKKTSRVKTSGANIACSFDNERNSGWYTIVLYGGQCFTGN